VSSLSNWYTWWSAYVTATSVCTSSNPSASNSIQTSGPDVLQQHLVDVDSDGLTRRQLAVGEVVAEQLFGQCPRRIHASHSAYTEKTCRSSQGSP